VFAAEKGPLYDIAALGVAGQAGKLANVMALAREALNSGRRTADAREAHRVLAAEPVAVFSLTARGRNLALRRLRLMWFSRMLSGEILMV
jgi:hypothetical protein